jgi:hypothetical protein
MRKITNCLVMAVLIGALIVFCYLWYEVFWPITVITARVQPYKVLTPIVYAGGNITYQVDACKMLGVPAEVIRTYQDGVGYPSITGSNNIPSGCHKTNVTIPVPLFVPPGKYHIKLDAIYHINAFRTETNTFVTTDFIVATQSAKE